MTSEYLLQKIGFADQDINTYLDYEKEYGASVSPYVTAYYDEKKSLSEVLKQLDGLAKPAFHRFTAHLLFAVGCALRTYDAYCAAGISEEIYFDTMKDITYKLRECRDVYGVFGNAVVFWYDAFFRLLRFAFGRLQFDVMLQAGYEACIGTDVLKKEDFCLSCHIPSSGPLDNALCADSYRRAHEFFKDRVGEVLPIICHSWLLFPPYLPILGKNSVDFVRDYKVFHVGYTKTFPDGWRIFNTEDLSDIDALPADTGLRRRFITYMKNNGKHGIGVGVIFHRL